MTTAAATAALSDSAPGCMGMMICPSHCASSCALRPRPSLPIATAAGESGTRRVRQRRAVELETVCAQQLHQLVRRARQHRLAEERAHRSAHGLGAVEIGARAGEHHGIHAKGVRRADDRSDVAGILHALEHDDVPQRLRQAHLREAHGKDRAGRMHERRGIGDELRVGRILRSAVRQRERRRIAPEHGRDLRAEL